MVEGSEEGIYFGYKTGRMLSIKGSGRDCQVGKHSESGGSNDFSYVNITKRRMGNNMIIKPYTLGTLALPVSSGTCMILRKTRVSGVEILCGPIDIRELGMGVPRRIISETAKITLISESIKYTKGNSDVINLMNKRVGDCDIGELILAITQK